LETIEVTFFDPSLHASTSVPISSGGNCSWVTENHEARAKYTGRWNGRVWGICVDHLDAFVEHAIKERQRARRAPR
jgi:hypothetical protein